MKSWSPSSAKPVMVPRKPESVAESTAARRGFAANARGSGRGGSNDQHWNRPGMDCDRLGCIAAVRPAAIGVWRAYQRRARAPRLAGRAWKRVAFAAAHQVLVPDGMGGFHPYRSFAAHAPRAVLVLDTRRVAGLIFGGDQMSDWTVMGRGRRYTFDNPQPALL